MNHSRLEKHIFVCTNERPPENPKGCCSAKGGHDIRLEGEVLPDLGPELTGRSIQIPSGGSTKSSTVLCSMTFLIG